MVDGIINVYKEAGFTSHDVVAKLRGILHQKKIGHTGTLDPEATGVLPVCLGKGTRLCELLTDKEKTYVADVLLGVETDTQDMTGEILSQKEVLVTQEEVEEAISSFQGEQMQIPPMYSALKVNGKKLYQLAREGKVVERKPRKVCFQCIRVLEIKLPRIRMEICCSKGTYIRTLCHDLGQKLGCGGAMERLVRTKVGSFALEDSVTLSQIEESVAAGTLGNLVISPEMMFRYCDCLNVSQSLDKLLLNGNPLDVEKTTGVPLEGWLRTYDSTGRFVAIYTVDKQKQRYYPVKMFL